MEISIVSIAYNFEDFISETFQSVKKSVIKNYEYLFIDGGSMYETYSIAKEKDHISNIVSELDKRINNSFFLKVKLANWDLYGFLNI
jgi:glycosyltransferase involved in cell wall biosynthesis